MRKLLGEYSYLTNSGDSNSERIYPIAGSTKEDTVRWERLAAWATTAVGGLAAGAFSLGLVRRVEVSGDSMRPTLEPGDRLLVLAWRRIRAGDLVALADPRLPERTLVKRVAEVDRVKLTVVGDDPAASTDSRSFGPVPRATVLGRVVYRYAPSTRAALIRR
jgi:nickel-type superoxide dismutase maturation protease